MDITLAQETLEQTGCSCVVAKDGRITHQLEGHGVKPLLHLYQTAPETLKGAAVADKIIGKAAAIILVAAGVKTAYGQTMSQSAIQFLEAQGLPCSYGAYAPRILNRTGTDSCPMEKAVAPATTPNEGMEALLAFVKKMTAKKQSEPHKL